VKRMKTVVAAIPAAFFMAAIPSIAQAEDAYSGYGWEAISYIQSIDTDVPYTINFGNEAAREVLTPYAKMIEARLENAAGIEVIVTDDLFKTYDLSCANVPYHTITLRYRANPTENVGESRGVACADPRDWSAWGGYALLDSDYWTKTSYFSTDPVTNERIRKNVVLHEAGHVMGLSHPNPVDENGKDIFGPCIPEDLQPLMCVTPKPGGYQGDRAGMFTPYDAAGLRQLVTNEED
jgi:hypothetical protein